MFKNFLGFNLVEQMHKLRHNKIFNPLKIKRKTIGLLFVTARKVMPTGALRNSTTCQKKNVMPLWNSSIQSNFG